jgi:hypothetical protein
VNVISDALVAKRKGCPSCGARPNVACSEIGRQYVPLAETHLARLALVSEAYQGEDPRVNAES